MKNLLSLFKRRGLSLLVALSVCMSMLPVNALAAEAGMEEGAALSAVAGAENQEEPSAAPDTDAAAVADDEIQVITLTENNAEEPREESEEKPAEMLQDTEPLPEETTVLSQDTAVFSHVAPTGDIVPEAQPGDESADVVFPVEELEEEPFDLTQTQRPGQSEDVTSDIGSEKSDETTGEKKDWSIFYDKETDTYQLHFNIGADASGDQTFDLTQALELLGQYAKDAEKAPEPEKPVAPEKYETPEAPVEPQRPVPPDAPEKPEEPAEPSAPEGLDKALDVFQDMVLEDDSILTNKNSAIEYLVSQGYDADSAYVKEYAQFMIDAADNANDKNVIATGEPAGYYNFLVEYLTPSGGWDDKGNRIPYTAEERRQMAADYLEKHTPEAPVYQIDPDSAEWKEYEARKAAYDKAMAEYEALQDAYEEEHGVNSPEYQKYLAAKAEFDAQMSAYTAKLAELEAAYQTDMAAYQNKYAEYLKQVEEINKAYTAWKEADLLQPGDVRKFEIFFTSDSKHTYKYKNGSFTLATPDWGSQNSGVNGFDGQMLPGEYVDKAEYHVTLRCDPIQDLLIQKLGVDPYDAFNGFPGYVDVQIREYLSQTYGKGSIAENLNAYLLDYYNAKDGTSYTSIDALVKSNPEARSELTKTETSGNKWFTVGGETFVVDAHLETVKYDHFYQNLLSFVYGDLSDIEEVAGKPHFNSQTGLFEYDNDSWTNTGYQNALAYYMAHEEIWKKTNDYFAQLLEGGLTAEQATWTSFMMALNIDGELTGNDWQDSKWPWYNSIQLEQMDIDFSLSKKDGETGETITGSETEFQIYYIDKVTNEDGSVSDVHMYCTYDAQTNSYTFVPTPSTVWTSAGELNINYAMMKDIVYYLQEITAPEGYDLDTNVYIVMNEDDYHAMSEEDRAALGAFDAFLNTNVSDDGLNVNVSFVNTKIVVPDPDPEDPETPGEPESPEDFEDPEEPDEEEIPDEPTPLEDMPETASEIPDGDIPLTDVPEEAVPLSDLPEKAVPLEELPDMEVPLADVPVTGDVGVTLLYLVIAVCFGGLLALSRKKREQKGM